MFTLTHSPFAESGSFGRFGAAKFRSSNSTEKPETSGWKTCFSTSTRPFCAFKRQWSGIPRIEKRMQRLTDFSASTLAHVEWTILFFSGKSSILCLSQCRVFGCAGVPDSPLRRAGMLLPSSPAAALFYAGEIPAVCSKALKRRKVKSFLKMNFHSPAHVLTRTARGGDRQIISMPI